MAIRLSLPPYVVIVRLTNGAAGMAWSVFEASLLVISLTEINAAFVGRRFTFPTYELKAGLERNIGSLLARFVSDITEHRIR